MVTEISVFGGLRLVHLPYNNIFKTRQLSMITRGSITLRYISYCHCKYDHQFLLAIPPFEMCCYHMYVSYQC